MTITMNHPQTLPQNFKRYAMVAVAIVATVLILATVQTTVGQNTTVETTASTQTVTSASSLPSHILELEAAAAVVTEVAVTSPSTLPSHILELEAAVPSLVPSQSNVLAATTFFGSADRYTAPEATPNYSVEIAAWAAQRGLSGLSPASLAPVTQGTNGSELNWIQAVSAPVAATTNGDVLNRSNFGSDLDWVIANGWTPPVFITDEPAASVGSINDVEFFVY